MYRILAILAALSIALCFCLPVAAASYQDDCMDVLNDHIREYNGFSRNISDFIVFSGCQDAAIDQSLRWTAARLQLPTGLTARGVYKFSFFRHSQRSPYPLMITIA